MPTVEYYDINDAEVVVSKAKPLPVTSLSVVEILELIEKNSMTSSRILQELSCINNQLVSLNTRIEACFDTGIKIEEKD